ncbi:MAG: VIT and VWA domain-containing protein, partial [Gammaproteobacteria bacterium]|nr:VIT and VWA domain-containing protein [Gammaproteobacteria bacterium]
MSLIRLSCCLLLTGTCALASAEPVEKIAGSIEATLDGQRVVLASLKNDYQIAINGDLANVKLTQTFSNPYDKPLNARYLFPLNRLAAVHAMTMRVGNEVISAEIQEIKKATQTFTKARKQGKAAVLLEQHRPNMFTQNIANLMPGLPVEVEIEYTQIVPRIDGAYELVVPMVVGPRFQPAGAGVAPKPAQAGTTPGFGKWMLEKLPFYPNTAGHHLPREIISERVSMTIDLEAPVPVQAVYSHTHDLAIRYVSSTRQEITFAKGKVLDNKDFVLRFDLAGIKESAGLLSHWEADDGGYFSLLIEPPVNVPVDHAIPREMVFLLDCSGSMSGAPMEASKRFMTDALKALRPTDTFRIIRFSDSATEFSTKALPATRLNIQRGLRYTRNLYGSGGTMMTSGIRQALTGQSANGTIRNVVFLTDGYIGNEVSVLKLVHDLRGDARLYAFGVGAGVNRYLMDELGRVGRGFTRYFDPTRDDESQQAVVAELVAKLQTPVLTNLRIDWGDLPVSNLMPEMLPDLYAGNSIRVTGRFSAPASGVVTISGTGSTQEAQITQSVDLVGGSQRPAIRKVWARTAIAEFMHGFITPQQLRPDAMNNQQLQAAVTDLGLTYGLATPWTA